MAGKEQIPSYLLLVLDRFAAEMICFICMTRLEQAIILAIQAHSGQFDKQSKPYFWHVLTVSKMGQSEEEQIVGALHDVLEDCDDRWKDTVRQFATPNELIALELLSRINADGFKKKNEDYYAAIKKNALALTVKANDIAHNTSPERMDNLKPEDKSYLTKKYIKAKEALGLQ